MSSPAAPLPMSAAQRDALGVLARSVTASHREVVRASALLAAADGVANAEIARDCGVTVSTVRSWRERFAAEGLARFAEVRDGRGRKASIPAETFAEIVRLTLKETPPGRPTGAPGRWPTGSE